jgi:hypothetical protein
MRLHHVRRRAVFMRVVLPVASVLAAVSGLAPQLDHEDRLSL